MADDKKFSWDEEDKRPAASTAGFTWDSAEPAVAPRTHPLTQEEVDTANPKTQFEKDRSGGGVWDTLKSMVPDPTGGHSIFSKEAWLGDKPPSFNPTGPGTLYSDLTRPLPKDLPTNVLSGGKPGGQDSALGRGIYRGASILAPLAGGSAENMESASAKGDTSGVATQAAVPISMAVAAPAIHAHGPEVIRSGIKQVGSALLDESGRPRPIARLVLGGDRATALGEIANPELADARVAKQAKTEALSAGRTAPGPWKPGFTPELGSPENPGLHSKMPTRMPKPEVVPLSESPYFAQNKAKMAATAAEEAEARKPVPLNQSPYLGRYKANAADMEPVPLSQSPNARVYEANAAEQAKNAPPKIIASAEQGPRFTGNEGRAATWTNEDVTRLARQGNREAIQQLARRGLELPPNARYVAGDLDMPRAVYNPRAVTRFTPEGEPITQGKKVVAGPSRIGVGRVGEEMPSTVYRVQDVGSSEINPESHAHATESLEEAKGYREGREAIQGTPQEIRHINPRGFAPEHIKIVEGPNGKRWVKFGRNLKPRDYLD